MNRLSTFAIACSQIPRVGWKLAFALMSAVYAAIGIRVLAGITVGVTPSLGWAAEFAHAVLSLELIDFAMACFVGGLGGMASLFQELKRPIAKFSVQAAVGHMFTAQFASLIAYLLAVQQAMPVPLGLVFAGMFGWLGAAALDMLGRKMFGTNPPRPEVDPPTT